MKTFSWLIVTFAFHALADGPGAPSSDPSKRIIVKKVQESPLIVNVESGDDHNTDWVSLESMKNPKLDDRKLAAAISNVKDTDVFEFTSTTERCASNPQGSRWLEFSVSGYVSKLKDSYPNMDSELGMKSVAMEDLGKPEVPRVRTVRGVIRPLVGNASVNGRFLVTGKNINDFVEQLVKEARTDQDTGKRDLSKSTTVGHMTLRFAVHGGRYVTHETNPVYMQSLNSHPQWPIVGNRKECTYRITYRKVPNPSAGKKPGGKR